MLTSTGIFDHHTSAYHSYLAGIFVLAAKSPLEHGPTSNAAEQRGRICDRDTPHPVNWTNMIKIENSSSCNLHVALPLLYAYCNEFIHECC